MYRGVDKFVRVGGWDVVKCRYSPSKYNVHTVKNGMFQYTPGALCSPGY